ncbi:hypothetical protein [Phytohabitans suffuscus]|uniref:Tat pathway signal sequence domain protein n=1 Tax=Phytohabitans suffuscus TaxID=624315 RepID=A0A6F8YF93_9ACTN|nr:hypothetical protein [Phytohabitans suffuscus]BCB84703.1 hypothetical protein Psuf_020160 [Phytohabitans suffuscus]
MKLRNVRRSLAALGVAVATAVSVIAVPAAAQAQGAKPHHGFELPLLRFSPSSGSVNDDPMANFSAGKKCPAGYRTLAMVALQAPDGTAQRLSANFVPTDVRPSGVLNTALRFVILSGDLTTGYYEVDLLCYNAAFEPVKANVNVIKIDVEAGTWRAIVR